MRTEKEESVNLVLVKLRISPVVTFYLLGMQLITRIGLDWVFATKILSANRLTKTDIKI